MGKTPIDLKCTRGPRKCINPTQRFDCASCDKIKYFNDLYKWGDENIGSALTISAWVKLICMIYKHEKVDFK